MSTQNQTITTKNLLSAVVNLPKSKFDKFVADAKKLKRREEHLLAKLPKFDLSVEEKAIYKTLLRKFRAQDISKEEHKKMLYFTDKLEGLNVERLKCLLEIAKIRNKTLREVMKELEIFPPQTI